MRVPAMDFRQVRPRARGGWVRAPHRDPHAGEQSASAKLAQFYAAAAAVPTATDRTAAAGRSGRRLDWSPRSRALGTVRPMQSETAQIGPEGADLARLVPVRQWVLFAAVVLWGRVESRPGLEPRD